MPIVTGVFTQLPEIVRPGIVDVGILSFLRCRETTELCIRSVDHFPLSAVIDGHGFRQALIRKRTRPARQQVKAIYLPSTFKIPCQFGNFRHSVRLGVSLGIVDGVERVVRLCHCVLSFVIGSPHYIYLSA